MYAENYQNRESFNKDIAKMVCVSLIQRPRTSCCLLSTASYHSEKHEALKTGHFPETSTDLRFQESNKSSYSQMSVS